MPLVLCYHHVHEAPGETVTSPELFREHILALRAARSRFVSFDEFVAMADGRTRADPRAILLTTDDGHADNWYHAFPIFEELSIPAVYFVITDAIGEGPPRPRSIDPHASAPGLHDRLNWSELERMQRSGLVSVQSHTAAHVDRRTAMRLGAFDAQALEADLVRSREAIRHRLGTTPTALAWPWGFCNSGMRRTARRAGFGLQFSVVPGCNGKATRRDFLYRYCADGLPVDQLVRKVSLLTTPGVGRAYSITRFFYNRAKNLRHGY